MKKYIAIALTMIMLLSTFVTTTAFADGFEDVAGLICEDAINYLAAKGIVNGRAENAYAPLSGLTRAEMTAILMRAYGVGGIDGNEQFTDVPREYWAYGVIEAAYAMGIINGTSETAFEPDASVTYEQAVKMMICMLDGEEKAQSLGGYPNGYIAVAEEMGILEGVEGENGKEFLRGSMAQLVYNCIGDGVASADGPILSEEYAIDWEKFDDVYDWMAEEKIRGVCGSISWLEEGFYDGVYKRLNEAGVNTAFLTLNSAKYDVNKGLEEQRKVLETALNDLENYDFHPFVKIHFGDNSYVLNNEFGSYHPGVYRDFYQNSPCPLSNEYWNKKLVEPSLMIAEYPEFEGIVLDFEMYSGGASRYNSPCLCDNCWSKFIGAKQYGDAWSEVEITERSNYVKNKGKDEELQSWFKSEIIRLCENIRDKVLDKNPDIIFAYMPNFEWITGITEGLGTPEHPVIVLSEDEYWGSLADTAKKMKTIKDESYPAVFLPGLYMGAEALSPATAEEKMIQAAPTTAGYWIFSAGTLYKNEDYYPAVERGNKALDKMIESGELPGLPAYEVNRYSAKKIAGTEPTEAEWDAAEFTEEFLCTKSGNEYREEIRAKAKILYSDTELFVRVFAKDDMSKISVPSTLERDGNMWAGDCVEVYWTFEGESSAAQYVSDLGGNLWDGYSTGVGTINAAVDFEGLYAETELLEDGWEMTMRIPGTQDGIRHIQSGDTLRMEICRYRKATISEPGNEDMSLSSSMAWAPTYGSFMGSKSLFGYVTLD